jgi:hypothetical protein
MTVTLQVSAVAQHEVPSANMQAKDGIMLACQRDEVVTADCLDIAAAAERYRVCGLTGDEWFRKRFLICRGTCEFGTLLQRSAATRSTTVSAMTKRPILCT